MRGKKQEKGKNRAVKYCICGPYVGHMSRKILYKSLPPQPKCLSQAGKAASLPTTPRKRFAFISLSEIVTDAAIMEGLHGYVIGYWKRVFATKQRRRYLICLKTKARILRESTAQSVESLIPQIHLWFHQCSELLTLAMPQMADKISNPFLHPY